MTGIIPSLTNKAYLCLFNSALYPSNHLKPFEKTTLSLFDLLQDAFIERHDLSLANSRWTHLLNKPVLCTARTIYLLAVFSTAPLLGALWNGAKCCLTPRRSINDQTFSFLDLSPLQKARKAFFADLTYLGITAVIGSWAWLASKILTSGSFAFRTIQFKHLSFSHAILASYLIALPFILGSSPSLLLPLLKLYPNDMYKSLLELSITLKNDYGISAPNGQLAPFADDDNLTSLIGLFDIYLLDLEKRYISKVGDMLLDQTDVKQIPEAAWKMIPYFEKQDPNHPLLKELRSIHEQHVMMRDLRNQAWKAADPSTLTIIMQSDVFLLETFFNFAFKDNRIKTHFEYNLKQLKTTQVSVKFTHPTFQKEANAFLQKILANDISTITPESLFTEGKSTISKEQIVTLFGKLISAIHFEKGTQEELKVRYHLTNAATAAYLILTSNSTE